MLILMLVFSPVLSFPVSAQAMTTDHEKMAADYDAKVMQQDALIQEHEKMKKDLPNQIATSSKGDKSPDLKDAEKHCDKIIEHSRALKNEFQEFSKWHRMRAAEAKGM